MRLLKLAFTMVLATTLAGTAWSQSASTSSTPRILGYLNPIDNSFQPLTMPQPIASPAAISIVAGKLVVNFTITVASTIPGTTGILCSVTASVSDISKTTFQVSNAIVEEAAVTATRSSPTAAKCTVTIPYSWRLANPTTDTVTMSYTLFTIGTSQQQFALRSSTQFVVPPILVPKTGTTTTESVAATI